MDRGVGRDADRTGGHLAAAISSSGPCHGVDPPDRSSDHRSLRQQRLPRLRFQKWIPGGYGIRDIGRISVILLIPVALGVALLVERLQRTHRWAASWAVALGCMLEQGVTTPAYDSRTNRATIAAIAAQVDPHCEAFYYHPWDRLSLCSTT